MNALVENFCLRECLIADDPYDIWKTDIGFRVKMLFNKSKALGLGPAGLLTFFDTYVNNRQRHFYTPKEYPIVRAQAALVLLRLYEATGSDRYLTGAVRHIEWLGKNFCPGYRGVGWGCGFEYPVAVGVVYGPNTPYTTITPYALEAYVNYRRLTGALRFDELIHRIHRFFAEDVVVLAEDSDRLVLSYGPFKDRVVVNANSYSMYAYALLAGQLNGPQAERAMVAVPKLYRFIRDSQREDGSWLYSLEGRSFVDCFHTCFVLKNLIKTHRLQPLPDCTAVVERGFSYLMSEFRDPRTGLFRRFTVSNKPSLVRFDLYDNAEVIGLAVLSGQNDLARELAEIVHHHFVRGSDVYSQIDMFGTLRNRNTLRWAVMPYLLALSQMAPGGSRIHTDRPDRQ